MNVTFLTYALIWHQFEIFKFLLELDCDHTVVIKFDSILFHICVRNGDINTLHYLVNKILRDINLNNKNENDLTTLERAKKKKNDVYE